MRRIIEVESVLEQTSLQDCVLQDLDLSGLDLERLARSAAGAVFLGCQLPDGGLARLSEVGALVLPRLPGLPFNPYRTRLYSWQELRDDDLDLRIYQHFLARGRSQPDVVEALAERLHDHAIEDAVRQFLAGGPRMVGIMGGHSVPRDHPDYARTAEVARRLVQEGYTVATGGGPGLMEAGNLGAYLGNRSAAELEQALTILRADDDHYRPAIQVLERFPEGCSSLAVPTWFYGHEPSNVFASAIAKFFSNSLREDGLLAMCLHGVIYSRGSAGTTQEIFQDAAQNHYCTFGWYSPMVFLGRQRYEQETRLYETLKQLAGTQTYASMLFLSDSPEEVVAHIVSHPPIPRKAGC
jgi:predicted Rossmann-fold nucleotide-binding protein